MVTDFLILNHGQKARTTFELTSHPLLISRHINWRTFEADRFNVKDVATTVSMTRGPKLQEAQNIWIQEFRNTGFDNSVAQARLFVEKSSFEIESQFKEKRSARKKRMFGYEHIDEPIQSFEMQYRVNFFNTMIDAIIVDT
ncbi:zinc finger MYM-type protein 1 [Trichonephila clavipes]|nr:zinc finger MYM-type protein 1 [Trichonephila clavipes]